jgi:hypothetical protein
MPSGCPPRAAAPHRSNTCSRCTAGSTSARSDAPGEPQSWGARRCHTSLESSSSAVSQRRPLSGAASGARTVTARAAQTNHDRRRTSGRDAGAEAGSAQTSDARSYDAGVGNTPSVLSSGENRGRGPSVPRRTVREGSFNAAAASVPAPLPRHGRARPRAAGVHGGSREPVRSAVRGRRGCPFAEPAPIGAGGPGELRTPPHRPAPLPRRAGLG